MELHVDREVLAFFTAIVGLCVSLVTLATVAIGLSRGAKRDEKIHQLAINVDGRLSQLLEERTESSHAKGMLEGAANEKAKPS